MTNANTDGARMVAACSSGDEAGVRELLRETPSLAHQVPGAPLVLTWAVVQRRLDLVQSFLARGAAVDLPDDQSWTTPRFWARHFAEPAMMQAF